ncbi:three component ABC system middle component [Serratia liquefaciens]|uniref:three component ABC system middle component n=1 Tax=Serratia liquefaciens TaxID=614 RepID=UPI00215795AD|nr:three component ABC system middle component [Serratia liquefaciens]
MKQWDQRPFEIRNLFNPAFCGVVLFRAMQSYEEENSQGIPFSLALLVLPLCLQKDSRQVFAENPRRYLLKTIENNPKLLVNFANRVNNMLPFTLEAFGVLMERGCFVVTQDGRLKTVPNKVRKSVIGTEESISCQRVARYIGKEFARIADRVTVYTTFGIRP